MSSLPLGSPTAVAAAASEAVMLVFNDWRSRQKNPSAIRLTKDRIKLIERRLSLGYEPEDFILLFAYAWGANTREAQWWRGEAPGSEGSTYLGLDNLLRETNLADRIDRARAWAEQQAEEAKQRAEEALAHKEGRVVQLTPGRSVWRSRGRSPIAATPPASDTNTDADG